MEPHVRTVQSLKMSPKRRTDLKIWQSKAKNLEELDFDVRKSLAPRKSAKNNEKPEKKSDLFFRFFRYFRQIFEELGFFWRQNRIPRGFSL